MVWFGGSFGVPLLPPLPRYTEDFGALLSGRLRLNSSPQFLHHVLLPPLPAYDPPDGQFGVGMGPREPPGPPNNTPVSPQAAAPSSRSTNRCGSSTPRGSSECHPHPNVTSPAPRGLPNFIPTLLCLLGVSWFLPQTSHSPLRSLRGPGAPQSSPKPDMDTPTAPFGGVQGLPPTFPPGSPRGFRGDS